MFILGVPTSAEAYPTRPITIIIPFGPGGAVDIAARILAENIQTRRNITLNIVCKPGGAGAPAMMEVARARPNGYTFGFPSLPTFSTTPQVQSVGYSLADFRAVAQISVMTMSLAVNADSPFKTVDDLMQAARANPGRVNFATHGVLSTQRLFMARILGTKYPDVNLPHVAYASGHEVSTALLGRHVVSGMGVTTNHKPYVLSGDFRIIGIASPERLAEFPDSPTFAEQLGPEFIFGNSHGLIAPKKTPDDRVLFMQNLIKEALEDPDVQEKFAAAGLTTDYLPADEFQKVMQEVWDYIGGILKEYQL